jgi:tryptophan 7-halogenase
MFQSLLVLGAGSAGLLAALSVKRKIPAVRVRVLRSPDIGVIGVGESTTPNIPKFLFDYLGINRRKFYEQADPTWKLGIHFLWGPRESFEYSFFAQLDARLAELPRPMGFYCDDDFTNIGFSAACMTAGRCFPRRKDGNGPDIHDGNAFHLENVKFVKCLESFALEMGIEFIDGKLTSAERGPQGIAAVTLEDGRRFDAHFFIDASGFRSELLGRELQEPFIEFSASLFNDRAILGSWERTLEPILPYTTAETMDAGWAWRIDHEKLINRGYVFSSAHTTDDQAREEFARKNPRAKISDRVVKFRSGRYRRTWVDNVLAIGNASGFVEPLEATALMVICWQCGAFVDMIAQVGPTPTIRDLINQQTADTWDEIRDFLTLHYTTNTRLDTPYWQGCRNDADASRLTELLKFYRENGPSGFARYLLQNRVQQFGIEGFLVILMGNKVPYDNHHHPAPWEVSRIHNFRQENRAMAASAYTAEQCLAFIRHPNWRWFDEQR